MCFDVIPESIVKHPPVNTLKLKELTNKKQYSSSLLERELHWKPAYNIEKALSNLISHYEHNKRLV